MTLTADRLRDLLEYDPVTGVFKWRRSGTGRRRDLGAGSNRSDGGHSQIRIDGVSYYEHRLAFLYVHGMWPTGEIDHADGNPSNNAIANLREASHAQNQRNRGLQKNNSTGFKGVSRRADCNRWTARIRVNRKDICLGFFASPEEAHAAYCAAAKKFHEEFAHA